MFYIDGYPNISFYVPFSQMSNVHPWFANVSIDQAAAWTASFFQTTNVQPASLLPNSPKFFIAETGWPTVNLVQTI
jgi:exo-beta-1,3-glucanase (GH17 family)